jgi:ribonuclease-3
MKRAPSPLEARLGHRFADPGLLQLALTPPSAGLPQHHQRLEFLGDALLNAAVTILIHREKPGWSEGLMSKLRATLVSTASLARWADDLQLALATGPQSPRGATSPKGRADAVEALVAAVHEDAGREGFSAVLALCEARFGEAVRAAQPEDWKRLDAKTVLQERAAALGLAAPAYHLAAQTGPDHAPLFRVEAVVGDHRAHGTAGSRKAAEAQAARSLLDRIGGG